MEWLTEFTGEAQRRRVRPDPDWGKGARLAPVVVRSVQRFQIGEAGDGANLIAKAQPRWREAVRLFVAEEQNHARMLADLLTAAGATALSWHWSDSAFVRLRRALGVRLELRVLLIAEIVALSYYRALATGTGDGLTRDVAARILADEERHVPFHVDHLRNIGARGHAGWRLLMIGALAVVLLDHGPALRALGVTRLRFAADVLARFEEVAAEVRRGLRPRLGPPAPRMRPRGLV